MDVIPKYEFKKIVSTHDGNIRLRSLMFWNHFLSLCFTHLASRNSFHDTVVTRKSLSSPLYHMGIKPPGACNAFLRVNINHPCLIYDDLTMELIEHARRIDSRLQSTSESIYGSPLKKKYLQPLRRVHLIGQENYQNIDLLINMTTCSVSQIFDYYKSRWQIDLFFNWINLHLRIKAFYGQTFDAVKTQILRTIWTYLTILIFQKKIYLIIKYTMMQNLSVAVLDHLNT